MSNTWSRTSSHPDACVKKTGRGAHGSVVVEALCYEPEGRGFDTQSENYKTKTPWPLVRERTIPTERPPLVDEI
jgi:hypothetical protein